MVTSRKRRQKAEFAEKKTAAATHVCAAVWTIFPVGFAVKIIWRESSYDKLSNGIKFEDFGVEEGYEKR